MADGARVGGLLLAGLLCAGGAAAQPTVGTGGQGDVAVTIYTGELALITDTRPAMLAAGESRVEFPDVSSRIRPETVSLTGAGIEIVEQNFDFDLLSPTAMMQKAVGQEITLVRTNPATGAETRERAKVLAVNGGVVLDVAGRIEILRDDSLPVRVIFDGIPANLRARPTLSVTVDAKAAGPRPLTLRYLSEGLSWRADYVALYDEAAKAIDLQGWVTLNNNSGTGFANAKLLLVVSDQIGVRRGSRARDGEPAPLTSAGTESAKAEELADMRAYPLPDRTTIASAQQKQIAFLDAAAVPATRGYAASLDRLRTWEQAEGVLSTYRFSTGKGGVGDAMPAGSVRLYVKDARGAAQFVGESRIGHTPAGSALSLATGRTFDVKFQPVLEKREKLTEEQWSRSSTTRVRKNGVVTVTETDVKRHFWRTHMRYIFTNARSQPVTVEFTQAGLDGYTNDTRVPSESIAADADSTGLGYSRTWQVTVPANGRIELTVQFDTLN
ncbi:MAG TPA: DUF4139 domain-containing protein [Sphingopyxis sp.]|nr:DUF4139 domain-containing protein [Sphingopyxis sp.]HMQ19350.1 DUF4139 domain-containing protein [Sphingopyxis sp.]